MDSAKMEYGIRLFLDGLGERFPGDGLDDTPARVARAWVEDLVGGYREDPDAILTWVEAPPGTATVLVRDISFASICVHHLLPFVGRAHVAYLPTARLAGLSKIGKVIEVHARRLQIQERLTQEVLGSLERVLKPRGCLVLLEAEHTCMTLRGVKKEGSRLTTMASSGLYEHDAAARAEIFAVIAAGRNGGGRAP
jgi:GTP cyclohydrolase I